MSLQLTEDEFDSRMDILYDEVSRALGQEVAMSLWDTEFLNTMSDFAYEHGIMSSDED
jgi:hypothetical protein